MATATRRKKKATKPKFRASWKGPIHFGLVSFEVQAVNAQNKEQAEFHFHLLHEPDHQRIHYAKVCPKHGEVPNDEIIEGYEYSKGKYVEIEKEELDDLRTAKQRALSIDAFVANDEIDPMYFDGRMYYLLPASDDGQEAYGLLAAAMQRQDRCGIGQVVFSGREQLAMLRAVDGMLTMSLLHYDAELRKPAELKSRVGQPKSTSQKLKLAEELIRNWAGKRFDLSSYKDRYREKMADVIEAKKKGGEVTAPAEDDEPEVINLMDALKRSLDEGTAKRRSESNGVSKRKRKAPARRAVKRRA